MTATASKTTDPAHIAKMADEIARNTGKGPHPLDGTLSYRDRNISITTGEIHPNIEISIPIGNRQTTVFLTHHSDHSNPDRYNPGLWTRYLADIHQKMEKERRRILTRPTTEEQERFAAVNDSETFPQYTD